MYKVSVIVPVYNTAEYLDRCLESLVNQTMNEIEIILVNDGSTDNSQIIIDRYLKAYPEKVKSIIQNNSGQASARNEGMKIAKGEFIAFVDSDDFIQIDAYENVYNYAKINDLDIACFDFWEIKGENRYKSCYYKNLNCENDIVKYIIYETSPWNKIIKRKLIEDNKLKFVENHIYEDLELIPTLVLYTNKIGFINEYYYNYIIRENSTMRKKNYDDKLKNIYPVMNSLYRKLEKSYYKELEYLYIEHLLHGASMRFMEYKESENEIQTIYKIMKEKFPDWRKNYYYKQMDIKYKIICNLIFYKKIKLLKIILKK